MLINLLKSKLHRATVTDVHLNYEGSIGIDASLMKQVGIIHFEQVDVYNITNGERFTTYAIPLEENSGKISIQGAAAHKAKVGDLVIICSYATFDAIQAGKHTPSVIVLDENNKLKKRNY